MIVVMSVIIIASFSPVVLFPHGSVDPLELDIKICMSGMGG